MSISQLHFRNLSGINVNLSNSTVDIDNKLKVLCINLDQELSNFEKILPLLEQFKLNNLSFNLVTFTYRGVKILCSKIKSDLCQQSQPIYNFLNNPSQCDILILMEAESMGYSVVIQSIKKSSCKFVILIGSEKISQNVQDHSFFRDLIDQSDNDWNKVIK